MRHEILFTGHEDARYSIRARSPKAGEASSGPFPPPYTPVEAAAILRALEFGAFDTALFSGREATALRRLGLLANGVLAADFHERVGKRLLQALAPGDDLRTGLQTAVTAAGAAGRTLHVELRFDETAVALSSLPWELLRDTRQFLVPGGRVEITRYISYPGAPPLTDVSLPVSVLHVEARPVDASPLPMGAECKAIQESLGRLLDTGSVRLEALVPPTYANLTRTLSATTFGVVHFDGHGGFGRLCQDCGSLNVPEARNCGNCLRDLTGVQPEGYLAFESEHCAMNLVSGEEVGVAIAQRGVQLMVLSACQSAALGGGTLFAGVAPRLILAGVPAVLAMQFSVRADAAEAFVSQFYYSLANGKTLVEAVADGRRQLFSSQYGCCWFTPVLYLRSRDGSRQLRLRKARPKN